MANKTQSSEQKLIQAMLAIANERDWSEVSLADIAEASQLSLSEVFAVARNKGALIDAYIAQLDQVMLDEDYGFSADMPVRDKLFDLAMTRFEAMQPNRLAIANILNADGLNRFSQLSRSSKRTAETMLEAAGVASDGVIGQARTSTLSLAIANVGRTFLKDDSEDLSSTMRALDKSLTNLERWAIDFDEMRQGRGASGGFGKFAFGGAAFDQFKDFGERMRSGFASKPRATGANSADD